ncbi:embryo defective protein 1303 [Trifolium pratense]|uniref:Embryo defective protein 1303 n=1 Tax=Trifolium pratense TaxID=57577 RepID=A0A2K3P5T6_TRIPR|nr:embryo defective protein 1303 [Trifolium pratense]
MIGIASIAVASLPKLPPVRRGGHCIEKNVVPRGLVAVNNSRSFKFPRGLVAVNSSRSFSSTQFPLGRRTRSHEATIICAAAFNAKCGAEQTQTVTQKAPTITHFPAKEKSPQLDGGRSGFPPRNGDGGGGGGGNWSGGFFFFGFLAFLGFLNDKESESEDDGYAYSDNRRRRPRPR